MGKGRYLKAAERACARKARFETAASAEAFVERRYRAYRCVVCGGYHLTSGHGERAEPEPVRKEPPGPKLRDLDWSAVLDPKPPKATAPVPPKAPHPCPSPPEGRGVLTARCAGSPGKDGRVLLVIAGRLVKSRTVELPLRKGLREGVVVTVEGSPPQVVGIMPE